MTQQQREADVSAGYVYWGRRLVPAASAEKRFREISKGLDELAAASRARRVGAMTLSGVGHLTSGKDT